jgi:GNAT superfamily N-acetyltransferase
MPHPRGGIDPRQANAGSPEQIEPDLSTLAEDAVGYLLSGPGEVREIWPSVVLFHSPNPMPEFGMATHVRLAGDPRRSIRDVRAWFAAHGRRRFVWSIGPSTTPRDLERRLLASGAEPNPTQPMSTAMVLDHEPPSGHQGVEIRRVSTFDDFVAQWEILFESFAMPDSERDEIRATLEIRWIDVSTSNVRLDYLALVDGIPVAMGSLRRTTVGPLWMAGGATLPRWRGQGLYRALVRARWEDAVRLGGGALVVHASPMSAPVLARLGFRSVGVITTLADWASPTR